MIKFFLKNFWKVVLLATMFVYLFFANGLILKFNKNITPLLKQEIDIKQFDHSEVIIDYSIQVYDDIFNRVSVKGWSFCPTDEDNSNKKIQLVLKSNNVTYSVEAAVFNRIDVKNVFSNKTNFDNHGFEVQFSTIEMGDSIYDIYLIDIENINVYGIKKLGTYVKNKDTFEDFTQSSVASEGIPISFFQENGLKFTETQCDIMSPMILKDKMIEIKGWANLKGQKSDNVDIYVKVQSGGETLCYKAIKQMRMDVAQEFSNDYLESGFLCRIPLQQVRNPDNITMSLYLRSDEMYSASQEYHLSNVGGKYEVD